MVIVSYIMTGVAGIMVGILGSLVASECAKKAEARAKAKALKEKEKMEREERILKALENRD